MWSWRRESRAGQGHVISWVMLVTLSALGFYLVGSRGPHGGVTQRTSEDLIASTPTGLRIITINELQESAEGELELLGVVRVFERHSYTYTPPGPFAPMRCRYQIDLTYHLASPSRPVPVHWRPIIVAEDPTRLKHGDIAPLLERGDIDTNRVHWQGVIKNVALLSLIIAAVFGTVQLLIVYRRANRRRDGQCQRCGYPLLPISHRCPECGAPRPR